MIADSPISALVLTLNERRNIEACVRSLSTVAREVWVVDSGSTDGTQSLAEAAGARVVHHAFTTHADQWTYALTLPLEGEWIIALDADQRVSPELAADLLRTVRSAPEQAEGIYVNRLHVFRGKPLRHGGLFPKWMLKVFRKGKGFTDPRELLDFRFYVRGETTKARGLLVEDNRNEAEIAFWIEKHNRFSTKQAREEFSRARDRGATGGWAVEPKLLGTPDQRILYLKTLFYRMPLYLRPVAYFIYRYLIRLGFLDGKNGFLFHVLQAFWYRLVVDVKLEELERAERAAPEAGSTTPP